MESKKLKESLLVNLKSVTQSSKGGIPLSRLQYDYKQLIGTTIPFANMGYKSLEEFIQNIPHVVKLKRTPNGILFVEAVSDASTAHLASLISKQKGTTSKKGLKASIQSKRYGFHKGNIARNQNSPSSSSKSSITKASSYRDQGPSDDSVQMNCDKNTNIQDIAQPMNNDINLIKTNSPRQLKPMNTSSPQESCQMRVSHCEHFNLYQQQCQQMQVFRNQLKQQKEQMRLHEKKIQQQFKKLNDQIEKLSNESPSNAIDKEHIMEMVLKHLQSHSSTLESQISAPATTALSNMPNTSSGRDLFSSVVKKSLIPQTSEVIPEKIHISIKDVVKDISKKRKLKKKNKNANATKTLNQ